MELAALTSHLTLADALAAGFLLIVWPLLGWMVEHSSEARPSMHRLMAQHRREWMTNHLTRDPRVTDAMLLSSLREGTAFFASACLIAIGGGLALIGNTDRLARVASDLMLVPAPKLLLELRILLPLLLITSAFMKFVWAHRVFGYCAVMMGAVPNDPALPEARLRAQTAAELNIEAAKAFNRGLRATYFALGALGWLLGPWVLALATAVTAGTIWRREFGSTSRRLLLSVARQSRLPDDIPGTD